MLILLSASLRAFNCKEITVLVNYLVNCSSSNKFIFVWSIINASILLYVSVAFNDLHSVYNIMECVAPEKKCHSPFSDFNCIDRFREIFNVMLPL